MIRHLPTSEYCGLTIILSQASRFDLQQLKLLTGKSGYWFREDCLAQQGIHISQCDVRESEDKSGLLAGTKSLFCLGEKAMREWIPGTNELSLKQARGYIFKQDGITRMASFLPIDCYDIVDHESRLNPTLNESHYEKDDDEDESEFDVKRHGKTRRSNFRFWLEKDTEKLCRIHQVGMRLEQEFDTILYPSIDLVIERLTHKKDQYLYIDVETDSNYNINTIGFNFEHSIDVFVLPILRYNYEPAYGKLPQLFRALAIAFRDNKVVAHNGKSFDFFLFAWRYLIMINRLAEDTMLIQSRMYPEAEKSLGHCISMHIDNWTYHKDDGIFMPNSPAQEQALWKYNSRDVISMKLIHKRQREIASRDAGLEASIQQVNESIRPYLIMEMTGMPYDQDKLEAMMAYNDRIMMQYLRCMRIMCGPTVEPLISNQKCRRYFHDRLGYPVVGKTKTGNPSLTEKDLYKLQLKYPDNDVISYLIAYRGVKKESGSLKFYPMWTELGKLPTKKELTEHEDKYKYAKEIKL